MRWKICIILYFTFRDEHLRFVRAYVKILNKNAPFISIFNEALILKVSIMDTMKNRDKGYDNDNKIVNK